jgi:AraC-like DNA-binding protein
MTSNPRSRDPTAAVAARRGERLGLRTVRCGAETLLWPLRSVRIDPDVFVVTAFAAPAVNAEPGTEPLIIELPVAEQVDGAAEFLPTLRPMDGAVGRTIAELARRCERGHRIVAFGDTAASLWSDLLTEERALRARAERISCVKPTTRDALFRRLLLSADYIQGNFAEPLKVGLLAQVANLSPFHFARLFALVMGEPPHAFIVRKRLAVARRLLAAGLGRGEVAERTGFGSRSTLFRHLREVAATPA